MSDSVVTSEAPKLVEKFTGQRRVVVSPAARPTGPAPVIIPSPQPKMVQKLSAIARPADNGLRTDGPTLEEYVLAGYEEESYPPTGYAVRERIYRFAKLRGTNAKTVFPDRTSHQWVPKRTHGGGYLPTTSFETSDAKLAAKLREAAITDSSIREAPPR